MDRDGNLTKEEIRRLKGLFKKVLLVIGIVGILLAGWVFSSPRLDIQPGEYDFGRMSWRDGVVSTTLIIKNTGKGSLVIKDIETSCMCTTASIEINGEDSPIFGMKGHGMNPGWSASIPGGGKAQLHIYYDPAVHKEHHGAVTRTVEFNTNDPLNLHRKVRIYAYHA